MVGSKAALCREYLKEPGLLIIVRTDAIAMEGIDSAVRRLQEYERRLVDKAAE